MYRVYKDPEGDQFLEPSYPTSPTHKYTFADKAEEGYKKEWRV